MEVVATAKLYYDSGINYRPEGLWVKIKFKEDGKLFKRKLKRYLLRAFDCDNERDYVSKLNHLADNQQTIVDLVENEVKLHFRSKFEEDGKTDAINDALKKLKGKEIEVKVKVEDHWKVD